jgi:hypothetical protein
MVILISFLFSVSAQAHAEIKLNNETIKRKGWTKKREKTGVQQTDQMHGLNSQRRYEQPVIGADGKKWFSGPTTNVGGTLSVDRNGDLHMETCINGADCTHDVLPGR